MSSETVVLVILVPIAILLDLYLVSRLQHYRRRRRESINGNVIPRAGQAPPMRQAFFPFLKPKRIQERLAWENLFKAIPRFLPSMMIPMVALLLLNAGILQLRGEIWVPGSVCILLGMAGLIVGLPRMEHLSLTAEDTNALRPWISLIGQWALVIGPWSLAVVFAADHVTDPKLDYMASIAWVSSLVMAMHLMWNRSIPSRALLLETLKANRIELLVLLSILIVAFLLRTIDLSNHPYPVHGDEAAIGIEARRILAGEVTDFFANGWSYQSNWSFVPVAVSEIFLGNNILAIRMASAVTGTLAVCFMYLLGREMFSPTLGLLAASLLATLPYHVHFSRLAVANIVDSLFSTMMFWLLIRGFRKNKTPYLFTAGVVGGLSIYTYAGTRLIVILAGILFVFIFLREKAHRKTHLKLMFSFAGGVLLSAAPQAAFFASHSDIFFGRFSEATIFLNGWLEDYAAITGMGTAEILFEQFSRTIMVFIASPALGNFFNSPEPYLTSLSSLLFLLGMAYSLAYWRDVRFFVLLIWFWSVVLLGGVITVSPPANTRLVMTTPVLCLFTILGANKLVEYFQNFHVSKRSVAVPLFVALASITAYQNVQSYMWNYRASMYFTDVGSEFEMEIATVAHEIGPDVPIFVIGVPHVSTTSPTLTFLAPNSVFTGLTAEQMETFQWNSTQRAAFVAIPDYRSMLEPIRQQHPGGESGQFYRKPYPPEMLFEYYILSASNSSIK